MFNLKCPNPEFIPEMNARRKTGKIKQMRLMRTLMTWELHSKEHQNGECTFLKSSSRRRFEISHGSV